jgi:hypothetical protein
VVFGEFPVRGAEFPVRDEFSVILAGYFNLCRSLDFGGEKKKRLFPLHRNFGVAPIGLKAGAGARGELDARGRRSGGALLRQPA